MIDEKMIEAAIRAEVSRRVDDLTKQMIENAKKELERQVAHIAAGITLDVMKYVSVQRCGEDLVVRVKMEGFKS